MKQLFLVFSILGALAVGTVAEQPGNYARACESAVKPSFIPLPPGAVEPAGWLRDWALAAKEGITGHLDEYHAVYGEAWKAKAVNAPNAAPDGTGWPLEQCSYWLDGLVRLGYVLHDPTLIQKAKARLDPIVDGVNAGGPSFIYWKTNMPSGFDSWAHSQMGRALLGYYQATGEKRILDALHRAYTNYPVPMGLLDLNGGDVSGLCNLDSILETYSLTGDPQLLQRARLAIQEPQVQTSINQWLEGQFSPGHAVCAYEIIRLPALVYPWTEETRYLQASRNAFKWFEETHMLPYGVTSGEEFLSGIGAFRLTETCDVTADLWSSLWLYRITGESAWGDSMERAFFNAGAAPIARDFQTMCYYQSPNRIEAETLPEENPFCPGKGCLRFTRLGHPGVLCCVGAVNRIIPNYIMHMWMATRDGGLAASLYGPCTVNALAGNRVPVKLECKTDYPFNQAIRIAVSVKQSASFPLYLRIPAWCSHPQISVGKEPVQATVDQHGFARLDRQWNDGDTITLDYPMSVQVQRGVETEYPMANRKYFSYKSDAVFAKRQLPFESISYGPLLFALPIPDKDPNTPQPDAHWQYALDNSVAKSGLDIEIQRSPMPAKWNWPLNAPLRLLVPAKSFDWKPTNAQALPDSPVTGDKSETIELVPYGCTKFRISMFPVTKNAWK